MTNESNETQLVIEDLNKESVGVLFKRLKTSCTRVESYTHTKELLANKENSLFEDYFVSVYTFNLYASVLFKKLTGLDQNVLEIAIQEENLNPRELIAFFEKLIREGNSLN